MKPLRGIVHRKSWSNSGLPKTAGTFYYLFQNLTGTTWETRRLKEFTKLQKVAGTMGKLIDKIVFGPHWEAKIKCSGIMIVEFVKK